MRSWACPADTAGMQRLASRLWPAGLSPGGHGWSQDIGQLAADIVVVNDDQQGEIAGWAGITQPGSLALQVSPGRAEATEDLVRWMLQTAQGPHLTVDTYDQSTHDALRHHGFDPIDPPFGFYRMGQPGLRAAATEVSGALPQGYRIGDVRTVTVQERVEVHRIAWRPPPRHGDRAI